MTAHRTIKPTIAFLVALSAAWPAAACADPLLSGYGGPGAGSQVIIGSTLVNGRGGGGGGSAPAGESSTGTSSGVGVEAAAGAVTTVGSRASGTGPKSPAAGRHTAGAARTPSGTGSAASGPAPLGIRPTHVAVGSETLGLSHEDLLYILLALGAIAFTGVLTWRLTRATADRSQGSKGMSGRTPGTT
jgi:hypothetical protein